MKPDAADKCHGSSIGQSRQLFIKSCPLHTEILCQLFHVIFAIFKMLLYQSMHLKNQLGILINSFGCRIGRSGIDQLIFLKTATIPESMKA